MILFGRRYPHGSNIDRPALPARSFFRFFVSVSRRGISFRFSVRGALGSFELSRRSQVFRPVTAGSIQWRVQPVVFRYEFAGSRYSYRSRYELGYRFLGFLRDSLEPGTDWVGWAEEEGTSLPGGLLSLAVGGKDMSIQKYD